MIFNQLVIFLGICIMAYNMYHFNHFTLERQEVMAECSRRTAVICHAYMLMSGSMEYKELFHQADRALYRAKHAGKAQFCEFSGSR